MAPPASPRAFFSTPLKTTTKFAAKEPRISFGRQWRELLLPVGAVRVMVHNGAISSIKNVLADDTARLAMMGQFAAGARTSIFQLVRGEWLTKVELRAGADYFHAIRFHTNKRVSPWVGKAQGATRAILAPDGFVIHSFTGYWGHGLREIGALFRPLAEMAAPLAQPDPGFRQVHVAELSSGDSVPEGDYRAPFSVTVSDLGAVVVSADPDLKWLRVLSRAQVTELAALQDGVYTGAGEHWLQLMADECVTRVEVVHDGKVIKGVRWTTTLQTTPWIGQYPTTKLVVATFACGSNERVCGFYGARGRAGVMALGVVVDDAMDQARAEIGADTSSTSSDPDQWDVVQGEDTLASLQ